MVASSCQVQLSSVQFSSVQSLDRLGHQRDMRDDSAEIPIQSFMWQFRDKQGLVLKYMWTRACLVSGTERPVFKSVDIENHLGERPTLFLQFTSAQFLCQLAVRGNSKDDLRTSFLFLFFLFFF